MIKELAERIESGGDDAQKVLVDELSNISVQTDKLPDTEKAGLVRRIEIAEAEARRSRDELVQANLRLVISIAVKYQGHNVPLEDLIQEGNIGLIKAASKFDYRKGFKFSYLRDLVDQTGNYAYARQFLSLNSTPLLRRCEDE